MLLFYHSSNWYADKFFPSFFRNKNISIMRKSKKRNKNGVSIDKSYFCACSKVLFFSSFLFIRLIVLSIVVSLIIKRSIYTYIYIYEYVYRNYYRSHAVSITVYVCSPVHYLFVQLSSGENIQRPERLAFSDNIVNEKYVKWRIPWSLRLIGYKSDATVKSQLSPCSRSILNTVNSTILSD